MLGKVVVFMGADYLAKDTMVSVGILLRFFLQTIVYLLDVQQGSLPGFVSATLAFMFIGFGLQIVQTIMLVASWF